MDQDTLRMILREAVRETTTEVLQILLNAGREAFLQEHGGRKNGHYSRKLETASGQVGLAIPRDREGRYYPSLLQPYARRMVDVGEVAIALAAQGGGGAAATLRDAPHPPSVPSPTRSCRRQGNSGKGPCRRSWPRSSWMGCCSRRWVGRGWGALRSTWPWGSLRRGNGRCGRTPSGRAKPVHQAGLLALAQRERQVLQGLWHRGLKRVLLFITDGLVGLQPAIQRVYPLAEWPRCVVHGVRGGLSQVRVRDRGPLAEDPRRVYRTGALGALEELQARWGGRYPGVVRLWWVCASTTTPGRNPMERLIREIRRGTRVRDTSFPAKGLFTSCCTWSAKGKKGSGRRGSAGDLRRPKRHWSRCCGSGTSPVHRLLHIPSCAT